MKKVRVLFVCMGNICRSPTAQGVFEKLVREAGLADTIVSESAGTHAYHLGKQADQRALAAAARRGMDLSRHRARRATKQDFEDFDYVLAMDQQNLAHLQNLCGPATRRKLSLFMEFGQGFGMSEVPDPYYGGGNGFERVLDMVEEAARGLLDDIRRHNGL